MASATDEIEAIRVRIHEAKARRQVKADKLSKTEGRLARVQGNRRKPTKGSGKSLEDEIKEIVANLQEELQNDVLDIEAMESELQKLQENVEPLSAQPLQTPEMNIPGTGENITPPSTDVCKEENLKTANQEGSNAHDETGGSAVDPEQASTAEAAVEDETGGSTVDPEQASTAEAANSTNIEGNNPTIAANEQTALQLSSSVAIASHDAVALGAPQETNSPTVTANEQPTPQSNNSITSTTHGATILGTPQESASPTDPQEFSDRVVDVGPVVPDTTRSGSPNSSMTSRVEEDDPQDDDYIKVPETGHEGTNDHLPATSSPFPVVDNTVQAAISNVAIQSTTSNKSQVTAHLSQKRPAEDPNHNAEHDAKRTKRVQPSGHNLLKDALKRKRRGRLPAPHAAMGGPRCGHGVLAKHPKKSIQTHKNNITGTRGPQIRLSQHVEEGDADRMEEDDVDNEMEGGRDDDKEASPSSKGVEQKLGDVEESSGGERESPDGTEESSEEGDDDEQDHVMSRRIYNLDSSPEPHLSIEVSSDNEVADEESLTTMRLYTKTDLEDLENPLTHHAPSLASQAFAIRSENSRKRSSNMAQTQGAEGKKTRRSSSQGKSKQNIKGKQKVVAKREEASVRRQAAKSEDEGKDLGLDPRGRDGQKNKPKEEKVKATAIAENVSSATGAETAAEAKESCTAWEELPETEKAALIASAREAIRAYLSFKTPIPVELRSHIRTIEEFCPEAASISKALALHCLTSRYGNIMCLYHNSHDKAGKFNDTKPHPQRNHQVTGVPFRRLINPRNRPADAKLLELESKATNCGCHQNDVLWDFFWWKNAHLYSPTLNITEGWKSTRLDPRARGLIVTFLQDFTCTKLQDIYSGTPDENRTRLHQLRKMENNIRSARKELQDEMQRLAVAPESSEVESD